MGRPDESQFGLIARGGHLRLLGSTLSDPGDGGEGTLAVEWWDNFYHGHAWGIGGQVLDTRGKLFPSTGFDGTFTENTDVFGYVTGSRMDRMPPDGTYYIGAISSTEARLGFGSLTLDPPARDSNGELIDLDPLKATIFAVERMHKFGVEGRPTPRWPIRLEVGYGTRAQWLVDGDEEILTTSSLGITLGAWLSMGLGDTTTTVREQDGLSANDLAWTLYGDFGLALAENIIRHQLFRKPSAQIETQVLQEITGEEIHSDNPSAEDLPIIQSLAMIGDGGTDKITLYADSIDTEGNTTAGSHILFAAQILETLGYGIAGREGNLADQAFLGQAFAGANRLAVMGMIWNDTAPEWHWAEQLLAGGALMLGAYGLVETSKEWGLGMADGGFRTALSAVTQPDPTHSGFVLRSTYRTSLWSYLQHGETTGARGFFGMEHDLRVPGGDWLATGFNLSTPVFDAPNLATRAANTTTPADEDQPLPESGMPTTVRTEVTFKTSSDQHEPVWIEGAIGPHLATQFAGSEILMGAGLHAQIEFGIRLWGDVALRLGVRGQATLTNDGNELELTPTAGLTF